MTNTIFLLLWAGTGVVATFFSFKYLKFKKDSEQEVMEYEGFIGNLKESLQDKDKALKALNDQIGVMEIQVDILAKERNEAREMVINKILCKLGPLVKETTIEKLAELGANNRAQGLSDMVIEKLKKELEIE